MREPNPVAGRHSAHFRSLLVAIAAVAIIALAGGDGVAQTYGGNQQYGQPYDCGVVGPAANIVCSNPALRDLSDEAQDAFRELVRATPRGERPTIMRDQRDWSYSLGECLRGGGSDECLRQAYEDRISTLVNALGGLIAADSPAFSSPAPVPVERTELPPPEGAVASVVATPVETDEPPSDATDAVIETGTLGASDGAEADCPPVSDGDSAEPRGLARVEGCEAEVAAVEQPATDAAGAPSGGESRAILSATVWKAEIASGVRPGTIFVFHDDGALVTADCVESYRIGTWQIGSDGRLVLNEGNATSRSAEIVGIRDNFVRLQLSDDRSPAGRTLVLRPAIAPFSCTAG